MTEAIFLSYEEEFEGRVGLHGLPKAIPFYEEKCGMHNLGPDPAYSHLPYFELTAEKASKFIGE